MDRNEQGQGEGVASGEQSERLERLRGLIRRMDRTVDTTRDKRLGRVMVEPGSAPQVIPFPRPARLRPAESRVRWPRACRISRPSSRA